MLGAYSAQFLIKCARMTAMSDMHIACMGYVAKENIGPNVCMPRMHDAEKIQTFTLTRIKIWYE